MIKVLFWRHGLQYCASSVVLAFRLESNTVVATAGVVKACALREASSTNNKNNQPAETLVLAPFMHKG